MTEPTLTIDELKERATILSSTIKGLHEEIERRQEARNRANLISIMIRPPIAWRAEVRIPNTPLWSEMLQAIAEKIDWAGLLAAERDRLERIANGHEGIAESVYHELRKPATANTNQDRRTGP